MAAYYAARVAGGSCARCGEAVVPGRARCRVCLSNEATAAHRRARARRVAGLCVKCGAAAPPGRSCLSCLDKDRARHARRRAAGRCTQCGVRVPVPGKKGCIPCRAVAAWRRADTRAQKRADARDHTPDGRRTNRRFAAGQCPRCTAPLTDGRMKCADCLGDQRAANHERRARWAAAGRCTKCGHAREDPALLQCEQCRMQGYGYKRKNRAAGFCPCGRFREPGRQSCRGCLSLHRDAQRRRRAGGQTSHIDKGGQISHIDKG